MQDAAGIIISWNVLNIKLVVGGPNSQSKAHVEHAIDALTEENIERLEAAGFVPYIAPADQRGAGSVCYVVSTSAPVETLVNQQSAKNPAISAILHKGCLAPVVEFAVLYEPRGLEARTIEEMLENEPKLIVGQLDNQLDAVRMQYDSEKGFARMERFPVIKEKGYITVEAPPTMYDGSIVRALGLSPVLANTPNQTQIMEGGVRRVFAPCYATNLSVDPRMAHIANGR